MEGTIPILVVVPVVTVPEVTVAGEEPVVAGTVAPVEPKEKEVVFEEQVATVTNCRCHK